MLDVHPPHESAHSWKDFFIHIATICIGLLIAIGLEQTVEALHHRHQLRELNEALQQDNEKALRDDEEVERSYATRVARLNARIDDVSLALRTNGHAHVIPASPDYIRSLPVDPAWKAATTSGLVNIMSQRDVKAFSEVDSLIQSMTADLDERSAKSRRIAFEQRFCSSSSDAKLDFTSATRADLLEDLTLLSEELQRAKVIYSFTRYLRGCLEQVICGERDLDRIDDAENAVADGPALAPATKPAH